MYIRKVAHGQKKIRQSDCEKPNEKIRPNGKIIRLIIISVEHFHVIG